jgi:hypothetical protein
MERERIREVVLKHNGVSVRRVMGSSGLDRVEVADESAKGNRFVIDALQFGSTTRNEFKRQVADVVKMLAEVMKEEAPDARAK